MSEPSQEVQRQVRTPINFSLIVTGLFLVIIALLAFLWMRERAARFKAQADLAQMEQQYRQVGKQRVLQDTLNRMLATKSGRGVEPFARADLVATRDVRLDGENRQVLEIRAEAGRRLGFGAGDVIVVSKAPAAATQPASKPSTGSRP